MKKKLLFVVSTFSRAGAEMALLEFLRKLDPERFEISLFVMRGQGEMVSELPPYVRLLNENYDATSVQSRAGGRKLRKRTLRILWVRGTVFRLIPYILRNLWDMCRHRSSSVDMLGVRMLSDSAPRLDMEFDLAVAYLEGSATYYVADHVKATKKASFVHIDYAMAGFTRGLDLDCYREMDKIFAVSDEVRTHFLEVYPEYEHKLEVFHNILNVSEMRRKSRLSGGFADGYGGTRILSIGRLAAQKAFEISIEALKMLKDAGHDFRWYVLGDGDQRDRLERRLRALGLEDDFILCGVVDNPYPYLVQADLYVHASRYEGKSIAIQEAQILGCPVLASDCSGNRENVSDGEDGKLCPLTPEGIRDGILWLMEHPEERLRYVEAAKQKYQDQVNEIGKLLSLVEENEE